MLSTMLSVAALSAVSVAAPKAEQVHLQLQTGLLARETLRVDEGGAEQRMGAVGPGAGGVDLGAGYLLRRKHEVGARFSFAQVTLDDGLSDTRQTDLSLAGTYTHHWRVERDVRVSATGLFGVARTDHDGDSTARAPFVGVGGRVHWFATPRTSLHVGLEGSRSLGGRYEVDGVAGSSRFTETQLAATAGMNLYLGGKKARRR